MLTKYLLIADNGAVDESTQFYYIFCGKNDAGNLQAISLIASSHQWFFAKMDKDVAEFLCQIADSLSCDVYQLKFQFLRIKDLLKFYRKENHLPTIKKIVGNADYLCRQVNLNYRCSREKKVIQRAEAETRNKPKSIGVRKKARLIVFKPSATHVAVKK